MKGERARGNQRLGAPFKVPSSQTSARKMYRPAVASRNAQTPAGAEGWMSGGEIWLAGALVGEQVGLPCLNSLPGVTDWGVRVGLRWTARKLE
jgi:hypothetical protein